MTGPRSRSRVPFVTPTQAPPPVCPALLVPKMLSCAAEINQALSLPLCLLGRTDDKFAASNKKSPGGYASQACAIKYGSRYMECRLQKLFALRLGGAEALRLGESWGTGEAWFSRLRAGCAVLVRSYQTSEMVSILPARFINDSACRPPGLRQLYKVRALWWTDTPVSLRDLRFPAGRGSLPPTFLRMLLSPACIREIAPSQRTRLAMALGRATSATGELRLAITPCVTPRASRHRRYGTAPIPTSPPPAPQLHRACPRAPPLL